MTAHHAAPPRRRSVRHARHHRSHRILRGVALTTVGILAFGGAAAATTLRQLDGNVNHADISALVGARPTPTAEGGQDPKENGAFNILVLGSDWREGANGDIGGHVTGGMRSDTAIVMHVSADRERVELVSIPRDSLVDIPACTMTDGSTSSPQDHQMFNAAFATGYDQGGDIESAAACTWRTVEANTGVALDHFIVVDFVGFESMVDAIGGVPICIDRHMESRKAKLNLDPGLQTLDGATALAFARARTGEGLGDGSDINRIGNQQRLVAAMASQTLSKNLLTDWTDLLRLLNAATKSLTTDMSLTDMAGLGYNMRGIRSGNITFMTTPWGAAPENKNRIVWTDEAGIIWANVAADRPLLTGTDEEEPEPTATPSPSGTPSPTETAKPTQSATPTPGETKQAGRDAFDLDDTTATC